MDAGEGIIEVLDYKTGERKDWATGEKKDYKKLLDDSQLLLYNYAISKLYPQYDQAIMTIFFLRDGGPFTLCFDESDQSRFLEMLRKRFEEIKNNQHPQLLHPERKDFRCQRICHFCKTKWPGSKNTICEEAEESLHQIGYSETVKKMTRKNFSIGYYEAPG